MKKTVFSLPTPDESHSRNPFDRSLLNNVNFSAGMLVPTFCQFFFGHSHARINQRSFIRTAEVNKPAFPALPLYTDYFFVPMHQILTNWNAFRSRTNDRFSSRLGNISRLPGFTVAGFQAALDSVLSPNVLVDDAGFKIADGMMRLCDLLRFGWTYTGDFVSHQVGQNDFYNVGDQTPIKACVYQKIYYDHFRNTAYEANNVGAYNLDDLYVLSGDNETLGGFSNSRLVDIFKLHYVNYHKDFVNTLYPSLNFVSAAANGLQSANVLPASFVGATQQSLPITDNSVYPSSTYNTPTVNAGNKDLQGYMSLANIRAAFALEKLLRVSAFTPQHVRNQFLARFGYAPKSANLHESVRIGSFKNDIILQDITSTSDTSGAPLGALGSKGVGATDYEKAISYDVPEDGFIMGVSYVLPSMTYDAQNVDPINQQFVPEDWSLPEYENLGLQPLYLKNILVAKIASDTAAKQLARANVILGYQPRDMQYKSAMSENHGLFLRNNQLDTFVTHGRYGYLYGRATDTVPVNGVSNRYFKASPSDLNSLFVVAADGTELSDQFFGQFNIRVGVIQDKPILGIPKV